MMSKDLGKELSGPTLGILGEYPNPNPEVMAPLGKSKELFRKKPRFDHKLSAVVDPSTNYLTITGRIIPFNEPITYPEFTEVITHVAFNKTDIAHCVLNLIRDGKSSYIAHVYTHNLLVTTQCDGIHFNARVFLDLDFLVNTLDEWEVGYTMAEAPQGSTWESVDGKDIRRVNNVERLYSVILRRVEERNSKYQ